MERPCSSFPIAGGFYSALLPSKPKESENLLQLSPSGPQLLTKAIGRIICNSNKQLLFHKYYVRFAGQVRRFGLGTTPTFPRGSPDFSTALPQPFLGATPGRSENCRPVKNVHDLI